MPSVSVLLATFNGAKFISAQLESLARQTRLPDELVVTDDHSNDETLDIVRRFAAAAPFPVRIEAHDQRRGYRTNFMAALPACRSDLVAFCDQDDVWLADKLAVATAAFDRPDTLLFFHDAWLIDQDGARIGPASIFRLPPETPPLSAHCMANPYGFSMVCHRDLFRFNDLWPRSVDSLEPRNRMAHDQWVFFLASIFGTIVFSDARLVEYRQHGGNAYGVPLLTGWPARRKQLAYFLRDSSEDYRLFAAAAKVRAAILAEARPRLEGAWRARAIAGEQGLLRYAERLTQRATLYSARSAVTRLAALARLCRSGAYGTDGGFGFGRNSLAKDVLLSVLPRSIVTPTHPDAALRQRAVMRADPR
jgi:glycosyltransferase involved in cell wall biosynthesis